MVGNLQDYHHGRKEAIGFQCQVNLVLLVLGIQDYHHGRKEGSNWFSMSGQPGTASAGYTRLSSWKEAIGFQCLVNLVLLVLGIQDYHHGRKEAIGFQCLVNLVLLVPGIQDYHHRRKEAIGFQCLVNLVLLVLGIQDYHHGRKEAIGF